MRKEGWVPLAALVGLALVLGFASSADAQSAPPCEAAAQAEYVGMDTCVACHEDVVTAFKRTPHAESARSCEGCHGPGKAHVDGEGDKTKIRVLKSLSASASSAVCMECHNKAGQKHWTGSGHDQKSVSCASCHNPHPKGEVPKALLAKPQMDLCTSCHMQKKAQLLRSGHMPMREGKLQCTSCHNPHGTANDKMILQTSVNENCYSCH